MAFQAPDGWVTFSLDEVSPPGQEAALTSLRIQEQMLRTALTHGNFAREVAGILKRELGLTAVTLFVRTRGLSAFTLKAASGFDYSGYRSFLLPDPSYPSIACSVEQPTVLVALAPLSRKLYLNYELLHGRDIASLVVVPFYPPERKDTDYPDPLGALCLYAPEGTDLDALVGISGTLQSLVGTLYVASLEQRCMQLRSEAVKIAAFEPTLTATAEGLVSLVCRELGFDAGSLWLLEPRRQQVQLRAAFPSIRRDVGQVSDNIVRLNPPFKSSNPLALAYNTLHKIHYPRPATADGGTRRYADFDPAKIVENYGDNFHNVVAVPLRTENPIMLGHVRRSAVGVFSLTNKFTTLGGIKDYMPTTWEDLKLVSYMTEITTVLVFQGLQALDHEADYERRIHGLKINLISARDTLLQLEERAEIKVSDSRMSYHLPNAIEWIREMEQQVGRSDKIERLKVSPESVSLRAGLAKAVKAARISARAARVDDFVVDAEDVLGSIRPNFQIFADGRAFQTILRNLFENSLKYRDKDGGPLRVEIWIEVGGRAGHLRLHYADNGVGIPKEDRAHLFENGFRGSIARRVNVQGGGIGLHECKILMEAMKGSIQCVDSHTQARGAEFLLEFPLARAPYLDRN